MGFDEDVEDVVLVVGEGLEGDGVLLLVVFSVDQVDSPGKGHQSSREAEGPQFGPRVEDQHCQGAEEDLELDLHVESPAHAESVPVVDQVVDEEGSPPHVLAQRRVLFIGNPLRTVPPVDEHRVPHQDHQQVGRQEPERSLQHQPWVPTEFAHILRKLVGDEEAAHEEEDVHCKECALDDENEGSLEDKVQ